MAKDINRRAEAGNELETGKKAGAQQQQQQQQQQQGKKAGQQGEAGRRNVMERSGEQSAGAEKRAQASNNGLGNQKKQY